MSRQDLDEFRSKYMNDPEIQRQVAAGAQFVDLAAERGLDVTLEDIVAFVDSEDAELSDYELQLVSGGQGDSDCEGT